MEDQSKLNVRVVYNKVKRSIVSDRHCNSSLSTFTNLYCTIVLMSVYKTVLHVTFNVQVMYKKVKKPILHQTDMRIPIMLFSSQDTIKTIGCGNECRKGFFSFSQEID